LDLIFIKEHVPDYLDAVGLTLTIAFWGILLSIIIGFLCSVIRYYQVPMISKVSSAYIELSRNTPLLIQLFLLYFGLPKTGIVLSSENCAIIGLSFLGGSYIGPKPSVVDWKR
jgi:polar amino acid transport system permease protein